MKIAYIMVLMGLAGCCNRPVPVHTAFPEAPVALLQPSPPLVPLPVNGTTQLSDILDNANTNYGRYHEISARLAAWIQWYNDQKRIFEEVR